MLQAYTQMLLCIYHTKGSKSTISLHNAQLRFVGAACNICEKINKLRGQKRNQGSVCLCCFGCAVWFSLLEALQVCSYCVLRDRERFFNEKKSKKKIEAFYSEYSLPAVQEVGYCHFTYAHFN